MKKQSVSKKLRSINTFAEGDIVQGFYLCVEKNLRYTKTEDLYIDIELRDISGRINAKIWDNVAKYKEKFHSGDAIAASGVVECFKDLNYLRIKKINRATIQHYSRYGFDPSNIVPASKTDPNKMCGIISDSIVSLKNDTLKKLVGDIYKANKKKLMYQPDSLEFSYNYRSGLLEHILSMVLIAKKICNLYDVDRDLVISGILLIRIGKIKEINSSYIPEFTKEGKLIGHIALGRDIVKEATKKIKNFPLDLVYKIEHIILSQDVTRFSKSQKSPLFPESLLVNKIKDLDSKMNKMDIIMKEDQGDGDFTNKYNYFRGPLLKKNAP